MTFNEKVQQFTQAIETAAISLGLEFVSGPNTTAVSLDHGCGTPSFGTVKGQERAVYLLGIADA